MRVTNVPASKARRKKMLKRAKGFTGRNKNLNRVTHGVVKRAMRFEFVGRKLRKRDFRALWILRIGVAAKSAGTTYSKLMDGLKKTNIVLNRKMLSELAVLEPAVFTSLVQQVQQG